MLACSGLATASQLAGSASGSLTSAGALASRSASLHCYPVTISTGTVGAGNCGREGCIKVGTTFNYNYGVLGTNFTKFYTAANVGIDVEGGDYHHSMGDPIAAQAVALRSAKELAENLDHEVGYGWPAVWNSKCCLLYYPNSNGVLQLDQNTGAEIMDIESATEKFGKVSCGDDHLHLGDAPPAFSDSNYVVPIISRASGGLTSAGRIVPVHVPAMPVQVPQDDPRDDESDEGSVAPEKFSTPAELRRLDDQRMTASKALKLFNNCRLRTEAAAQKVLSIVPNERIKALVTRWIWDTGAGIDIVSAQGVSNMQHLITKTASPLALCTANGDSMAD